MAHCGDYGRGTKRIAVKSKSSKVFEVEKRAHAFELVTQTLLERGGLWFSHELFQPEAWAAFDKIAAQFLLPGSCILHVHKRRFATMAAVTDASTRVTLMVGDDGAEEADDFVVEDVITMQVPVGSTTEDGSTGRGCNDGDSGAAVDGTAKRQRVDDSPELAYADLLNVIFAAMGRRNLFRHPVSGDLYVRTYQHQFAFVRKYTAGEFLAMLYMDHETFGLSCPPKPTHRALLLREIRSGIDRQSPFLDVRDGCYGFTDGLLSMVDGRFEECPDDGSQIILPRRTFPLKYAEALCLPTPFFDALAASIPTATAVTETPHWIPFALAHTLVGSQDGGRYVFNLVVTDESAIVVVLNILRSIHRDNQNMPSTIGEFRGRCNVRPADVRDMDCAVLIVDNADGHPLLDANLATPLLFISKKGTKSERLIDLVLRAPSDGTADWATDHSWISREAPGVALKCIQAYQKYHDDAGFIQSLKQQDITPVKHIMYPTTFLCGVVRLLKCITCSDSSVGVPEMFLRSAWIQYARDAVHGVWLNDLQAHYAAYKKHRGLTHQKGKLSEAHLLQVEPSWKPYQFQFCPGCSPDHGNDPTKMHRHTGNIMGHENGNRSTSRRVNYMVLVTPDLTAPT